MYLVIKSKNRTSGDERNSWRSHSLSRRSDRKGENVRIGGQLEFRLTIYY